MEFEKIGQFLRALRKERNLTQDQLAAELNFDRSVISRWECSKKLPSVENIDALAKFYNVSINELVYGARMNKGNARDIRNVPIRIISESERRIHRIRMSCLITVIAAIIVALTIYFVSNYNSIKVYRVGGSTENYVVKNTLMIISKHRSYLNFGEIDNIGNDEDTISYDNYELYVKNGDTKIILANREDGDLVEGLEKIDNYLNFNNIKKFINNIYIDIYDDDDNIVTMKLDATLEMTNNKIFYINDDDATNIKSTKKYSNKINLPKFVRKNFKYDEEKDLYTYSKIIDDENIKLEYNPKSKKLFVNKDNYKYSVDYSSEILTIFDFDNKRHQNILYDLKSEKCLSNNCADFINVINELKNMLKNSRFLLRMWMCQNGTFFSDTLCYTESVERREI